MKFAQMCMAITLFGMTSAAFPKDGLPSSLRKPVDKAATQESNPVRSPADDNWQRYLRWHRDATAMRGRDDSNNRYPLLQL